MPLPKAGIGKNMKTRNNTSGPSAASHGNNHSRLETDENPSEAVDIFSAGILNSLSSHICVVDSNGRITAINRAWSEFGKENGGTAESLNEGSNYFDACQTAADRDGLEAAGMAVEGIKKVLGGQADLFEMEYDCHSPDEKRWFLMRVSPLQFHGNKAVVSHIDITEKKRVEEELASLHAITQSVGSSINLESVTQHVLEQISLVVKPDLCLVFLREGDKLKLQGSCPSNTSIVDEEKQTHRVGQCLCGISVKSEKSVFSTNITADHRCTYRECKAAGITSFGAIPLMRQGQAIGTIGLASFEPRDFSKNRRFLESAAADIAIVMENSLLFEKAKKSAADLEQQLVRRQELEAQLLQTQKMEAIGTLAGGIAHQFNNLLAVIKGNLDLLERKQRCPEEIPGKIARINKAVSRATELVRQILSFSRPKSLQTEPLDLSLVLREDINFLRSTIPTSVEILTSINPGPICIDADNSQLQQILINLSTNAVHAMNSKGLLTISLDELELSERQLPVGASMLPGYYARLSVRDSGIGMTHETVDKIFDPFYTTKETSTGAGLGLSVVHGIVRAHGGFISVDSTLGHGSTFHIYFPMVKREKGASEPERNKSLPEGKERILFVDDEAYLVDLGVEMLEALGYSVTGAMSGNQALQRFIADPQAFDLVITDQTMPGMLGIELSAELVKIRPDIPIILCSGYSAMVSEDNFREKGIRKFCMKPMSMKQFALAIRKVLKT
jgi:PAS domain S-box-containing protein